MQEPSALSVALAAAQSSSDSPDAWRALAAAADACRDAATALEARRRVAALCPDSLCDRAALAGALRVMGHTALPLHRAILDQDPQQALSWWGWVEENPLLAPVDLRRLESSVRLARAGGESWGNRIVLLFSLARAYEADGRYAEAWGLLNEANGLAASLPSEDNEDAGAEESWVLARRWSFHPVPPEEAWRGRNVVFLVGMPRSGSTLVEQILAAHPDVVGAGELDALPRVLAAESQRRGQSCSQWAPQATPADWARLGADYMAHTERWQSRILFTDKLPDNWQRVGMIRAMLPGATIIHCARSALDTCLACYRQLFRPGHQAFSYTFEDLAEYWACCEATCSLWAARYPGVIHRLDYEALTANPAVTIDRLLGWCRLAQNPACLAPHAVDRPVYTLSAFQVRRPIHGDMRLSASYGALLNPLRAALARAAASKGLPSPIKATP